MKTVTIYTDGACSGNPGPGGWAAVLIYKGTRKEISGYVPETTNNRMELFAAVQALMALKEKCIVEVNSDSSYLVNAFTKGWIENWQKNNWKTSTKNPVENQDLWNLLLRYVNMHEVHWNKVRGHQDTVENNRCDELARKAISDNRKAKNPEE